MRTPLFSLILTACLFACNRKNSIVAVEREPDFKKAESFLYHKNDSAFYYFNKVVSNSKDSLQIAMAYNGMAVILSDAGDYFGAQENLLISLSYLDEQKEKDRYCISSDYNELGGTSLNLKNYDAAIDYYDRALKFAEDDGFKLMFLNNKAVVYQKTRDFAKAIAIYDSILGKGKKDEKAYAMVLSNRARTRWLQDSGYRATPELLEALQIRVNQKDYWGQNASYAHLSDYYANSHPDSALMYADKMYAITRYLNSPDDEIEALQKLILLSPPQNIRQYYKRYQYLSDSVQTARNTAKNQFALIRYDAEKNKVENLKLQKENADKKVQILQQRLMIYGAAAAMILGVFLVVIWSRKRRQQMASRIRDHKLKTSQKVHDVVANGLYRIMTEIEHQPIEKESLLDKIEDMYERSRDISYEQPEITSTDFQAEIALLLKAFNTDTTRVVTAGNDKGLWEKVDTNIQKEVKHILQELMVNMKKHSGASYVSIRFKQSGNKVEIQYTDNGAGLPPSYSFGNGLTNTGNRIKNINGEITFTNVNKGLKIQVSFPIVNMK
ncbi:tetratricopeptide repeat-containing sensor histidine kinase [Chitinophaga polysaccharea]|uniref:tetratricopeptide repeat-containing sensor histidine kinase n=1 Tax=Chitinophaga polysaccharea TaxID=1293035 RepID=UPI0021AF3BDE|nr:ATP-binding protein [Chitinophaga polysaccharea]